MASDRDFDDILFGNWHDALSPTHRHRKFSDDVLDYLRGQVSFVDITGKLIYLQINHIEPLKTGVDEQYAFDFQISTAPPPLSHRPRFGKRGDTPLINLSIPYGETWKSPTIYGYTFTSVNTLGQNIDNLRDFVLRQQNDDEFDPLLDGDD